MKNTKASSAIAMALLMAAASGLPALTPVARAPRDPRKNPPVPSADQAEIEAWNRAVDQRKAAKRAAKGK